MSSNERPGVAIIFNFLDFDDNEHSRRNGSEIDVQKLINLYNLMNLKVDVFNNLNFIELNAIVNELSSESKHDFTNEASIHIVFMSHGDKNNVVYCKDGEFNFLEKLNMIFRNPTLTSKPKYGIVQACKGDINAYLNSFDSCTLTRSFEHCQKLTILTSSSEGFVSFLHPTNGALFINKYCNILENEWYEGMFSKVLVKVIEEVSHCPQAPTLYTSALTDDFSFAKFVNGSYDE